MKKHRVAWTMALGLAVAWGSFFAPALGAGPRPPESLAETLQRTGRRMEIFLEQFSSVKCTELVSQLKLNPAGKVQQREESTFDYLALLQATGSDLTVNESRLALKEPTQGRNVPLLLTNGFSTLLLIFHPNYQPSFEFSYLADEAADGRILRHIAFRHIRGTSSPAVLLLRSREYALDLEGEAWIEPDSAEVVRIRAGIAAGMEDVGLKILQSDVRYGPFSFKGIAQPVWLPMAATIDVETTRQHWRNIHRFTDYKHFAVDTQSSIPQTP